MPDVNIIYRDNGQGLSRDAQLLAALLRGNGHRVTLSGMPPQVPTGDIRFLPERCTGLWREASLTFERRWRRRRARVPWDINIFLESIDTRYLPLAKKNLFFPNQEWLTTADQQLMSSSIDLVLFKSRHAETLLASEAGPSAYVGFTSDDRRLEHVETDWNAALHVAGWNRHKGTQPLVRSWSTHPQWPELTIVAMTVDESASGPNTRIVRARIPDPELRQLQNARGIHFCLSEAEGFGHSINEARSCGAVVVVTNAPPMNELITEDTGLLVDYASTTPMARGTRYRIGDDALGPTVERLLSLSVNQRRALGRCARQQYERDDERFSQTFLRIVAELA